MVYVVQRATSISFTGMIYFCVLVSQRTEEMISIIQSVKVFGFSESSSSISCYHFFSCVTDQLQPLLFFTM